MLIDSQTLTDGQRAAKARVIDGFRTYLAARGGYSFLLSDDEIWKWIERLVESMNQHVAAREQSREVLRSLPTILHLPQRSNLVRSTPIFISGENYEIIE